jgi:MerR family transcriptional regulator, light-induced transcriptional regulator
MEAAMTALNPMAAEILEISVAGYAAAAASRLGEVQTADGNSPGSGDVAWRTHFAQRILELAAAIRVGDPDLFARRITWLRRAFRARGNDESLLRTGLTSLQETLGRELPESLRTTVVKPLTMALAALDSDLEPSPTAIDSSLPQGRLALDYITACLDGEPDAAIELVLSAAGQRFDCPAIYTDVLIPVQHEVGQLWHVGEVSVAEERLISETSRQLMALLAHRFQPKERNGRSVLAASVAGNAHDLGVRVVADLYRLAGWRCLFLGASVPAAEIARAAQSFGVELVVLSATLTTQLKEIADCIATIQSAAPSAKILVGGLAFEESPTLWQQIGADGYAPNVKLAVEAGTALFADEP